MGAAERAKAALRTRLSGRRFVVDVQHLYRDGAHAGDTGSLYTLASGGKVSEAGAAVTYAQALAAWLAERGASVLTNDPAHGILVGPYGRRNAAGNAFGAHAYLACHVNAGGGSYALAEYMLGTPGQALAALIAGELTGRFREIRGGKANALTPGQRGAVCIQGCDAKIPALVLEPFFGDNPLMQPLLAHDRLVALGEAIGEGLARWSAQHP